MVERNPTHRLSDPCLDCIDGAIADPTRRAIVTLLARGEDTVGGLAGHFPISFNGSPNT